MTDDNSLFKQPFYRFTHHALLTWALHDITPVNLTEIWVLGKYLKCFAVDTLDFCV